MDSILIVSNTNATLITVSGLLKSQQFSRIVTTQNANETRRTLLNDEFGLIIIDTPLNDEYGDSLALSAAESTESGIILLADSELRPDRYENAIDAGVFVLEKPVSPDFFYSAVKLLTIARKRVSRLESENKMLRSKLQEISLIDRAKCILIQYLNMTEQQAHHYIEKQAMDLRQSKVITAENILKTYDNEA